MKKILPFFIMLSGIAFVSAQSNALVPAGNLPAGPMNGLTMKTAREWVIPNGRLIQPAGTYLYSESFPLGVALSPDDNSLIVSNCGRGKQYVQAYQTYALRETSSEQVKIIFNGVAFSKDGQTVWVCGGGAESVLKFRYLGGKLTPDGEVRTPGYPCSLALSPDGTRLYVTCNIASNVRVIDTSSNRVISSIATGTMPYGIAVSPNGQKAWVSNWLTHNISVLDLKNMKLIRSLPAGSLPCDVRISPDGKTVCVANANTDDLTFIDAQKDAILRTIRLRPYPNALLGSIPNGLVFSPDSRRVYVTMAGNNAVGVVDLSSRKLVGMIPTGWYPTGITIDHSGKTLYVVSSKGAGSGPNSDGEALAFMMRGLVQKIKIPSSSELNDFTHQVALQNGFSNSSVRGKTKKRTLVPSGIKHVVFIVRENRTYDQDLGDIQTANGDPALTMYGEDVTPNLHALASRYAIGDNMYGDGEVSLQGHQWTLGSICPDYTEKTWIAPYSGRGRPFDMEYAPQSYPVLGYMMDHCVRHGISCRMYGDTIRRDNEGMPIPTMRDRIAPDYKGWDLSYPDVKRADAWLAEFHKGIFPQFEYIWLPNDHTAGAQTGKHSPRAMVADNDLATGRVIEALSKNPEWKDTVVFLTEDDTQDGHDHVDAHRNILLVAGGRVREGSVARGHYSIASIYTTIEMMLGLPPMNQYDDLADPITGIWTAKPNIQPYKVAPERVSLGELNIPNTPEARLSAELDLSEPDANEGPLMEKILWLASKEHPAIQK
jgi:YVTN family beta-propeller protein